MYILRFVFLLTISGINVVDLAHTTPSFGVKIKISQGVLQGVRQTARNGRPYAEFLGIPYGKAGRFEEAEPADNWNGTKDATKFGQSCLQNDQFFYKKILGVEDCLFLNIYTPNPTKKSKAPLPVMVFIHGGGFQAGSGSMGNGKYFMSEDVVLVFINYRLGPFGFMKTPEGANFGFKDQILALKWVQQNIQYFNGDRNRVTIFGQSDGATGLFHGAISQSGVGIAPLVTMTDPEREQRKLGTLMDCPINNEEHLIRCLKKIDGNQMLQRISDAAAIASSPNKTKEFQMDDIPVFRMIMDSDSTGNVALPDTPFNLMQKGDFARVPWISGVNAMEGLFFPYPDLINTSRKSWDANDAASLGLDAMDSQDFAKIREYYVDNETDSTEVSANVTNLVSDVYFNYPAKMAAVLHSKHAPVYLYHFTFKGAASFIGDLNPSDENGLKNPTHTDELQYEFQFGNFFPEIKADSKFEPFSEFFIKLWVSFAKDGKVSPEKFSRTASAWTPVSSTSRANDDIEWYQLDKEAKMMKESLLFNSRLNFWNDLLGIK